MKNKLLNFTICQALIVIGMSLLCVRCQEQTLSGAGNVTVYDRSFYKVLSRRKRFLVWRPGSNVLLTASLVKPLAFPRPTGHNLIIEWDIFYPLPSSWRIPKKPAPPPPPPVTELPVEPVESFTAPKEVWQPDGGWTNDVIQQINEDNKNAGAERRNWQVPMNNQNLYRKLDAKANLFSSQSPAPVSLRPNPLLDFKQRPWQPSQLNRNDLNFNQRYFQSTRQSPLSSQSFALPASNVQQRRHNFIRQSRSSADEIVRKGEIDDDWEHYYAHRDRRDLYERIQNISPLNSNFIRSCLLRTMCEVQHFLHPRGYSLLHDMLRVIFTIPIKDDMEDEYSSAMRASDQDCVDFYKDNCPVSILALLLHTRN